MARSVPQDMMVELWSRISLKKLFKMKLVSKEWASNLDLLTKTIVSKQPQRILYTYVDGLERRKFRSVPEEKHSYSSDTKAWECAVPAGKGICTSPPVNGLICIYTYDVANTSHKFEVYNFLTGKSVALPDLKIEKHAYKSVFLGYHPVNDEFKVLSVGEGKQHVFSLGPHHLRSWREIQCNYPHDAISSSKTGLCKDGIIYYAAHVLGKGQVVVMSFDLKTEVLSPIETEVPYHHAPNSFQYGMAVYKGFVALVIRQPYEPTGEIFGFTFEARVLKNTEAPVRFLVDQGPRPKVTELLCVGTNSTGEVVIAPDHIFRRSETELKKSARKTEFEFSLYRYHEKFKEMHPRCHLNLVYDRFIEDIGSCRYIPLDTYLGTLSFIDPAKLLET